jgi:hypothetical protein
VLGGQVDVLSVLAFAWRKLPRFQWLPGSPGFSKQDVRLEAQVPARRMPSLCQWWPWQQRCTSTARNSASPNKVTRGPAGIHSATWFSNSIFTKDTWQLQFASKPISCQTQYAIEYEDNTRVGKPHDGI